MKIGKNFINGEFVTLNGSASIDVLNPATQELVGVVPDTDKLGVDSAVDAAMQASTAWESLPATERAKYLRQISAQIRTRIDPLANLITLEQGKILDLAKHEVRLTADYIDYMAEWALRMEGEVVSSANPGETILLLRKPIGVAAGILPWNFPFFLIARKLAPALITGNTIVIKSSEETPLNAFAFAELLAETDMPKGVVNILSGRGSSTGSALCDNPNVGIISFTGSVPTGTRIMRAAAENLTRVNLELGGKAPAIVLKDADLDVAARAIHESRIANSGQLCNCPERIYVDRDVLEEFTDKVARLMAQTRYGNPLVEQGLHMGPLVNQQAVARIEELVRSARSQGAEVVIGGQADHRDAGNHFQPSVLINCNSSMDIMRKEIFGPVLPIQAIDGVDEAIALSNDSEYGLTSSLYTRDLSTAHKVIRELRFGETFINRNNFEAIQGFHAGRKKSGIGGADGKHGLYEFTETHAVYIQA